MKCSLGQGLGFCLAPWPLTPVLLLPTLEMSRQIVLTSAAVAVYVVGGNWFSLKKHWASTELESTLLASRERRRTLQVARSAANFLESSLASLLLNQSQKAYNVCC